MFILILFCVCSLLSISLAVWVQKYYLMLLPMVLVGIFTIVTYPKCIPILFVVSFFIGYPLKESEMISIDYADVTFFLLFISLITSVFIPGSHMNLQVNSTNKKLLYTLVIFSFVCFISILLNIPLKTNKDIITSLWYLLNLIQLLFVFIFLSQSSITVYKEKIISLILILSFFEHFFALFQYLHSGASSIDEMRDVRGTFFQHHAMLGNMMIISLSLFLYRFISTASIKWRVVYGIGIVLSINTIIISGSRSVLIGIAIALIIIMLLRFRINKKYFIYTGILIIAGLLIIEFTPLNNIIVDTIENKQTKTIDLSAYGRLVIWKGALLQFQNEGIIKQLFGIGIGNFYTIKYPFVIFSSATHASGAHNNFLHVLLETGIIGLILFLTYFIQIIRELFKRIKCDHLAFAFLFSTLALIFSGLTQETFWFQPAFGPFWMYYTFILVLIFSNESTQKWVTNGYNYKVKKD